MTGPITIPEQPGGRARRFVGGLVALALALALGVAAAWPIYATPWLGVVAASAWVLGAGLVWARERWRFSFVVTAALILGTLVLTIVPVAVPQALSSDLLRGLGDGLAAIALGWKQVLTLSLPVGTYQTVLVPAYVVMLATVILSLTLAVRRGRWSSLAALPLLAPVAYGTVFGASALSAPLHLGPLTITAPRELALWLAAGVLGAIWVAWTSGADRRAALRLGRSESDAPVSRGRAVRGLIAAAAVVVALGLGALVAPALDAGARAVPRDAVDPEIVVRDRPSPLAAYRLSKQDDRIDQELFTVSADDGLPPALRLAVLDAYAGVDFHVSPDAAGRFTRFPSGDDLAAPSRVTVEIADGYQDIWAPASTLGAPPTFDGPRAAALADGFYVNRATGAAIAVPDGSAASPGLTAGDAYTAPMETRVADGKPGAPGSDAPLLDLETVPELARWIERQDVSTDGTGLGTLIERLRARGYLSHALSDTTGQPIWLQRLSEEYGTRFEPSSGGHSLARVEDLFAELNTQQESAGEGASDATLVAGIGDDEQFAAAGALIARALGYDSRVVVGVRFGDGVPGVPACEETCTGEHLAAWIEVQDESGNWFPMDVSPQTEQPPQRLEQGEQLPEFPTTPEERDAREVDPPIGLGEQAENGENPDDTAGASWLWPTLRIAGLSVAGLGLVLLPVLFLPLAKRRRARSRQAEPDPELRALGAWEEYVDRARDAGVHVPPGASRSGVAASIAGPASLGIAAAVDRAVFSPRGIDGAQADGIWAAVDQESRERAAAQTRWQRIRAAYALRSYGVRLGRGRTRDASDRTGTEAWGSTAQ
ncbi:hypothetical protein MUN76_12725 [Leucobacter rhizosphaerae]|uniref:Transglutaminase-like domain-containing protein n=1 Tax=Leucobacter rhizosphaerae TaxID=2932245 RepID=A0ABY4FUC0_9MICO|nr:transglutaminase domain-containing protein [Leucobacter rhizosphaerae]UOQ59898.1 hypothetical protein MUN76_12725 [Leucobacter rhizosphaerae]